MRFMTLQDYLSYHSQNSCPASSCEIRLPFASWSDSKAASNTLISHVQSIPDQPCGYFFHRPSSRKKKPDKWRASKSSLTASSNDEKFAFCTDWKTNHPAFGGCSLRMPDCHASVHEKGKTCKSQAVILDII